MSSTSTSSTTTTAILLSPDKDGLIEAGERLRSGGLVAFPTETVYGLGANALDEAAVRSIFTTKGRPLTDPLIVHVPAQEEALKLLQLDPSAASVYELLATTFWPGPLTLVGKAVEKIPLTVTAGTGFVGIRCPNHELAQKMLIEARVPVAAPSANRFGHVSPTTAQHVFNDLGNHDIAILKGEEKMEGEDSAEKNIMETCSVGIESTVAKVDGETKTVIIFRRGGISESAIEKCLAGTDYKIQALNKTVPHDPSKVPKVEEEGKVDGEGKNLVQERGEQAPGQCLTHYAPDVSTSLICNFGCISGNSGDQQQQYEMCKTPLNECVVIDFGGYLNTLKSHVMDYRDLSESGDVSEAAHHLFDTLRWTENIDGVKQVLLVDIFEVEKSRTPESFQHHEHLKAVADRMFRAASGHRVIVNNRSL